MARWTYRAPSFRAWVQLLKRGRRPIPHTILLPVPEFHQFPFVLVRDAPARFTFLNRTTQHGPGPPAPFTREPFGGRPVTYTWEWGDGTPDLEQTVLADGTPVAGTHTYEEPGAFTVKLTACNSAGCATLVRTAYAVVTLTSSVNIRRLSDLPRLRAGVRSLDRVSVRFNEGKRVSVARIKSVIKR